MSEFYSQVKNPIWSNAEHTRIDCQVNFVHLNEEFVTFTANPTDVMEYSKTIFDECVAGLYGNIGEYVAPVFPEYVSPPAPTKEQLMAKLLEIQAQLENLA
jgi:hypothetical protein